MSDQDPTHPKDDDSPEEDVPPPMDSGDSPGSEAPEEAAGISDATPGVSDSSGESEGATDEDPSATPSSNVLERGTLSGSDEKTMGMLVHILGGVTYILGPLILWVLKKDESPFVEDQGKEAMNFQITVIIAFAASTVIGFIPFIGGCLASLLFLAIAVANLIFAILGGLEANKGIIYRYPFALRLIK